MTTPSAKAPARLTMDQWMRRINRTSLGAAAAIIALIVLASSFTLGLLGLADAARIQAQALAESAVAPLMFQDQPTARELLQSLHASQGVRYAALYTPEHHAFAEFGTPDDAAASASAIDGDHVRYSPTRIEVAQTVRQNGVTRGSLRLQVGLEGLFRQLAIQLLVTLIGIALAIATGIILVRRLNRSVVDPLARLSELMDRVAGANDFSLRAAASDVDEIDALARDFNIMIEYIQQRDARLSQYREDLERQVAVRTADLMKAKDVAEAANRAKSDFLATMSHEIRTPLNGVLGMNELLQGSELKPRQREWAAAIQASGQHLLGVINDILDFSKIESGHMELEVEDFSIVEVVEEAVSMFAQPAQAKGLEIAAEFRPSSLSLPGLRGDPLRLRQVLANLIGNAIKFTEQGNIVVHVVLKDVTESDASVSLCVSDTGVGIAPEAHTKIFEHFSQADASTTRRYGGTGLGLAITRRIIGLMGGSIRVESEPGRGSRFHIDLRLPLAKSLPGEVNELEAFEGARVLIVDDNDTNRKILQYQLEGWRLKVSVAESGAEALLLLQEAQREQRPIQLGILDMHMPVMDGLELANEIHAREGLNQVPLMMLTSTAETVSQPERSAAGIDIYLSKPVRRTDLARGICRLLGRGANASSRLPPAAAATGPRRALRGTVLLAEDNPVNQQLALAMLEKLGVAVELAENGAEAVAQVASKDFDLVLMDCQMPVMDGFEATAAVRKLPVAARAQVKIVALTANALPGDEQHCLAAGMDGFLAKPYTLAQLQNTLTEWLPAREASTTTLKTLQIPESATDVISPSAIQVIRDLDPDGTWGLLGTVLRTFVSSAAETIENLQVALGAGDSVHVSRTAHAMKSSSASVGAEALSTLYRELDDLGARGRIAEARILLAKIKREQDRAVTRIREILQEAA